MNQAAFLVFQPHKLKVFVFQTMDNGIRRLKVQTKNIPAIHALIISSYLKYFRIKPFEKENVIIDFVTEARDEGISWKGVKTGMENRIA